MRLSHFVLSFSSAFLLAFSFSHFRVSAQDADPSEPPKETASARLSVNVKNSQQITVGQKRIQTDADLTFQAVEGELNQIRLALPLHHKILDISTGRTPSDHWTLSQEKERQLVTIPLKSGVRDAVHVEVHTQAPVDSEQLTVSGIDEAGRVQGIHAIDAAHEQGHLVVTPDRATTLSVLDQSGLTPLAAENSTEQEADLDALSFRYFNPRFQLKLQIEPTQPRIVVHQQTEISYLQNELRLRAELAFQIEQSTVSQLSISLPEGVEIDSVGADDLDRYQLAEDGELLVITFRKQLQGTVGVSVFGRQMIEAQELEEVLIVPKLHPENVARESGKITLFTPVGTDVIIEEGELIGAYPAPAEGRAQFAALRPAVAWTYNQRPVEIPISLVRSPVHLSATAATVLDVRTKSIDVRAKLDFKIENIAVDTLQFAVPAEAADSVRVSSLASAHLIRSISRADEAIDDWNIWTVKTKQPITGSLPLEFSYRHTLAGDAPNTKTIIPLPRIDGFVIRDQEQETSLVAPHQLHGEFVVNSGRNTSITVHPSDDSAEAIDVRDLTLLSQTGQLAYRYTGQPISLRIKSVNHISQREEQTRISRATAELVIGETERIAWRCRYRIATSSRQQLALELPADSEPAAAFLNQTQVALEKVHQFQAEEGWERYLVNVVRTSPTEQPFLLTLQFTSPVPPRTFASHGGKLHVRFPRFGAGPTPEVIGGLRAVLWISESFALIGTPDHYNLADATDRWEDWIGADEGIAVDLPITGHPYQFTSLGSAQPLEVTWWETRFYAQVISGAIIVIALILCGTSWRNRLILLCSGGLLFVFYAFGNPSIAAQALYAARYGIVGLIAIWLISSQFRAGRKFRKAERTQPTTSTGAATQIHDDRQPVKEGKAEPDQPR